MVEMSVEAIQGLHAEIKDLKAEVKALKEERASQDEVINSLRIAARRYYREASDYVPPLENDHD